MAPGGFRQYGEDPQSQMGDRSNDPQQGQADRFPGMGRYRGMAGGGSQQMNAPGSPMMGQPGGMAPMGGMPGGMPPGGGQMASMGQPQQGMAVMGQPQGGMMSGMGHPMQQGGQVSPDQIARIQAMAQQQQAGGGQRMAPPWLQQRPQGAQPGQPGMYQSPAATPSPNTLGRQGQAQDRNRQNQTF